MARTVLRSPGRDARCLRDRTRVSAEDDDHARAERGAVLAQVPGAQPHLARDVRGQPGPEIPADQNPRDSVRDPGHLEQLRQRHTMLDLIHAGRGHGPGQGHQRRARIELGSKLTEPRGAVARDQGHMRERFHVLDQRGAPSHAALEGQRRCEGRLGWTSVQRRHQRGLLSGHISGLQQEQIEPRIAVESGRRAVAKRHPQARYAALIFGGDDHDSVPGIDRPRGDRSAVEDQVRRLAQERPVLLARRLTLRAIGDDDRPAATRRHGSHLARHREGRATVAAQAGALHQGDEVPGCPAPQVGGRPMHVQVIFERHQRCLADPGQQPRQ